MSSGNFLFCLLMMLGPFVAVSSSNWLICWVGVELSFLGLMPLLVSETSFLSLSKESAMKYFCVQAMGSGLLLCGGVLLYMLPLELGILPECIFAFSLVVKLGVFPMHFWVPSVVSGLGWLPMFLMLTWQKVAPFLFMVNLVESSPWLGEPLLVIGGVSAIVGAIIGLNQTKLSPMLGASSITHSGWVLIGSVYGSLWVYFLIYCFSFGVLVCFMVSEESLFSGLGVLSLSGLPPFVLFLGKWSVLKCALGMSYSYWFLVLPLLGSIMSLFFYLKFFYSFYLEEDFSGGIKAGVFGGLSILTFLGVGYIALF
uniref:NADH-ubiquinone oxidoreductase chain 2 n=1 Tax=Tritonia tetraquetra TaxID=2780533 RepID=A0A0F6QIY3_9GAST|nr:NADH dehydrogenase subunit 2 [Tritonia tetraquetra]AKE07295.1 NADH dehydrogenase subunit 2 [Tritonia tetraquetra]